MCERVNTFVTLAVLAKWINSFKLLLEILRDRTKDAFQAAPVAYISTFVTREELNFHRICTFKHSPSDNTLIQVVIFREKAHSTNVGVFLFVIIHDFYGVMSSVRIRHIDAITSPFFVVFTQKKRVFMSTL